METNKELTIDGIKFKSIKASGNMKLSNSIVNTETDYDEVPPYIVPMINAVDIDWNNAEVKNIIPTGEPSEKTYLAKGGKETKISKKYKDSIDEVTGV